MTDRLGEVTASTSTSASADTEITFTPLPDPPAAEGAMVAGSAEQVSPCQSVTTRAIQDAIEMTSRARVKADENRDKNDAHESGHWAGAAALAGARAQTLFENLLTWLGSNNMIEPSGVVTNPSGASATHETVRDALHQLHFERHFTAISALYARKGNRDPSSALECVSLVTSTFGPLEELGTQALRCYLRPWFPES